ncbi:MAG: CpsD/CapB family tyrosine-protein kinase, partial [Desulfobacterales bacterium]|nr:CpsD/CapB family tyrosine-protein kinase [Desulfobacterales bacterium]
IKSLLITSAGPGEGKSTTVANLAISVAGEGKNVTIIDIDLRRASLHTYFDLPNDAGLSDLLKGKSSMDEVIQPTRIEGLNIIPSGPSFPDPGGLIESDQMGQLISDLKTRFDLVILDSAPLLVKSDALVLARYVDGLIIVLESEKTTRRAAHELVDVLAKAHIKPLGFILNRFSVQKGKYFYHQYYYGHYGSELRKTETSLT